jgi:predicted ribosome quality control (RQC) complex YloA/Tae2 family protein
MKTETVYFEHLDREIIYYVGQNAKDNFSVIDLGEPTDIWFHSATESSCHVIAKIPDIALDKKGIKTIIKKGAQLCKQNTNKLAVLKNTDISYTTIKNIQKTSIPGCVTTKNLKKISC